MITSAILLPIVFAVLGIIVAYLLITQVFIPLFNGQVLFPFLTESLASLQTESKDTYVFKVQDLQDETAKSLLPATQTSIADAAAAISTTKRTKKTTTKKSTDNKNTVTKTAKSATKQTNKKPKVQKPAAIKPIAKKPTVKKATTTKAVKKSVKTSKAPQ